MLEGFLFVGGEKGTWRKIKSARAAWEASVCSHIAVGHVQRAQACQLPVEFPCMHHQQRAAVPARGMLFLQTMEGLAGPHQCGSCPLWVLSPASFQSAREDPTCIMQFVPHMLPRSSH